jgi:shikimate kinase
MQLSHHLFLIGYRGTGKTTIARPLAQTLGCPWVDADQHLEQQCGRSIAELFELEGEAGFRAKESAILAELVARPPCVIATGGGVVLSKANRELLRASGSIVWLTADGDTIARRLAADPISNLSRPPLTCQPPRDEIHDLLTAREPLYRACADLQVDTSNRTPEDVVQAILTYLGQL